MKQVVKYSSQRFLKASNANAEDALFFFAQSKLKLKRRALL